MAASINNGWVNLRASNLMANHTNKIAANVTRLAGNTKFASGADNPAGYTYAQKVRTSAIAVNQVAENIQDGQAKFKIADAAYGSILDLLAKAKDLAAQSEALGETNAASSKGAIDALYAQVTKIEGAATFNGDKVIGAAISIEIGGDITATTGTTLEATGVEAAYTTSAIQTQIEGVLAKQGAAGAWEAGLGYVSDFVSNKAATMSESATNASNVNITKELGDYVANTVALQAAQYIMAQQNQNAYSVLNLLK